MYAKRIFVMVFLIILFLAFYGTVSANHFNDLEFKVYGTDDRTKIRNPSNNLPYSAVSYVEGDYGCCTGFMIGPHYAVTSASCIYDKNRGFTDSVMVCPNAAGNNYPCDCEYGSYMWIMDTALKKEYDVAVIKFDTALGRCSGWLGYKQISSSQAYDWVTMVTYDKDGSGHYYQYYTTGYLGGLYDNAQMIQYKNDTSAGSIGAPIVMGDQYVVGIDYGYNYDGYNIGVRLTDKVLDFLKPYWGK